MENVSVFRTHLFTTITEDLIEMNLLQYEDIIALGFQGLSVYKCSCKALKMMNYCSAIVQKKSIQIWEIFTATRHKYLSTNPAIPA